MTLSPSAAPSPSVLLSHVFHRFSPPTVAGHRPTTEAGLTVWKKHLLNLLSVCLPACLSFQNTHINFIFHFSIVWLRHGVRFETKKSPAHLQSFNQRGPFVSVHSHGFEDTRLSSRSNKVGLAGLKTLPAWSGILSPRQGQQEVTLGTKKPAKESVALVSASKNVWSVAAGWIDLTFT